MKYKVYLSGTTKPVYEYQTVTWLQKRLMYLAKFTSIPNVTVDCGEGYNTLSVNVILYHDGCSGWSAEPVGIPHLNGVIYGSRYNPSLKGKI